MSEWRETTLGDVIELKRGYDLPQAQRERGTVPIVSSSGISDFHNKAMVKAPGVVTGRYGTIGQIYYITQDFWPLNTSLYVRDFKGNDPKFISYFLKTIDFLAYSDKGAVPGVNRNHLHMAQVKIPHISTQRAIARILGDLDDKIELNRQINQTLEQMAQTIFKSWFVDFEPVKAKIEAKAAGRNPERAAMCAISGKTDVELDQLPTEKHKQLANTAALFPDELMESELVIIPKGWEVKHLGSISENHSTTFNFSNFDEVVFINTGDVLEGRFLHNNFSNKQGLPGQAKKTIKEDDILVSEIRPKNKRFAYVNFNAREYVVSTKFMVIRSLGKVHPRYLYQIIKQDETIEEFNMIAESRSGTFPQITFDSIKHYPVVVPYMSVQSAYINLLLPMIREQDRIWDEIINLATLRDTLLPSLLSGELSTKKMHSD